ncbi:MAG: TIGR03620 family F420-dependent LLM class oxidoreductase [Chromatiales bacterium]|nr:TIGR03620 family F420-dependent LLM class oxidoreductase [Chromatiales bacterium]
MDLGRLGAWYGADKLSPPQWIELVRTTERLGYGTQWYSESRQYEAMALGAFLLSHTSRIKLGTSIANIYARDAVSSRNGLYTLGAISGGRFVLGLGVSHVPLVEGLRRHQYGRPVATMREYLRSMAGDATDAGEWPVMLAALGPRMLALSGEMTRGALPYNVTPEHTAQAREILGPGKWLAVEQKVCLETEPAKARALARKELARYLTLPNYRRCWLSLGFTEAELDGGGSDRFLDAMVAWGTESAIRARLAEHFDAGADHVCIQPVHADGDLEAAKRTLEVFAPGG